MSVPITFSLRPHGVDVDFRPRKLEAPLRHFFRFANHFGYMQQRFRRDATAKQAHATQPWVALHKGDVHAEVRRQKSGGVSARTAAENYKLGIHWK